MAGNRQCFSFSTGSTSFQQLSPWTWISCTHLAKVNGLNEIYGGCEPIYFFEGYVTCNDCIEIDAADSSSLKLLLDCEPMTDLHFQERIINALYPINDATLQKVGHFGG
jgi:hypothetical protein